MPDPRFKNPLSGELTFSTEHPTCGHTVRVRRKVGAGESCAEFTAATETKLLEKLDDHECLPVESEV